MLIFVGSLKYSPVYKSHCCAFGKECEELGYLVKYVFSSEYSWMLPREVKEKTIFVGRSKSICSMLLDSLDMKNIMKIREIFFRDMPTHFYLHNYHLLNHYIAKLCKKHGCKFIYHVHEPYTKEKSAHGGLQRYWLYLYEFMERRLLRNTDIAVVSSSEGSRLFDHAYPWFKGKKIKVPLMYEDLGGSAPPLNRRQYITFVGPPVPAKGPDILLRIVDYANRHNLGWSFLLISRERIRDRRFLVKNNLCIFYKERISDEEFGDLIRRSFVVLTPYRRETQSSVILVSYMYGTPVVSSNVGGLSEFVICGKTGYLVHIDAPVEEWIKAIEHIKQNFSEMTKICRNYFLENFAGKNWKKYLDELLN
ncbi:MAG: glycosyltransferase family 4 protein [Candidatus Methanomethyliaceae archaeon]